MPKRTRTESTTHQGPQRILVVDDHDDAGRLLGKFLRQAGHEVAEVGDHHLALATLGNDDGPPPAVVGSFSVAGTSASLRLLDAIRNHHDQRVNAVRYLLISDHPRKRIFCYQAGADAILLRPFGSDELVATVEGMIARAGSERIQFRRRQITQLKASDDGPPEPVAESWLVPSRF